jgi:hypothetical protein
VLTGGAPETRQVGSHSQPQLVSERPETIGRGGNQVGGVHHELTLRLHPASAKAANQRQVRQIRTFRE